MKKEFSKKEVKEIIDNFFEDIYDKTPKEIRKIKRLSMKYKIPLKEKRKLFCKKCYSPYTNPSIRIKNNILRINCENCGHTSRWKIK